MRMLPFISALFVVAGTAVFGWAGDPDRPIDPRQLPLLQQAREAVERALVFLDEDETRWREKHNCATCHHGAMAVWALTEAKNQGYAVDEERLAELGKFAKARFWGNVDKPRDERDGYKIPSSLLIHLSLMGQLVPEQKTLTSDELNRLADYVARHQEPEGFWEMPVETKPFFEGPELFTLQAYLAMQSQGKDEAKRAARVEASREKAAAWLSKNESADSPQISAYRLLVDIRTGKSAKLLQPGIDRLLSQQNGDGGWSQDKDRASDAYMTGQALYALSKAGVPNDRREIQRGLLPHHQSERGWLLAHDIPQGQVSGAHHLLWQRLGNPWPGAHRAEEVGGPRKK